MAKVDKATSSTADILGDISTDSGIVRQPRVAQMVADMLRSRILSGQLEDGAQLPPQDQLLAHFGVSKPSIREAFQILETEGLLSVRRGKAGGAVIHVPKAQDAAYMFALVLEAQRVELADVGIALRNLEPSCAGLCAARPDRKGTVVPRLQEIHTQCEDSIDDAMEFTRAMTAFHSELVGLCGNKTMIVAVGALESLWNANLSSWAKEASTTGHFPNKRVRTKGLAAHATILSAIEAGDEACAHEAALNHFHPQHHYASESDGLQPVHSSALRPPALQLGSN